jgi:Bacterial Ig-like domain
MPRSRLIQHKLRTALRAGATIVAAGLIGCAGNGHGLNSNGQPIGSNPGSGGSGGTGSVTADFESIQTNVFTPICSPCHSGASAPQGLMLDAAHSYNLLVGVKSSEVPTLDRVQPGQPDQSYIVLKIEGAAGIVGSQMPLHETPLPQTTIDAIRQWITNGAPQATSSATPAVHAMQRIQALANDPTVDSFSVTQTSPMDEAVLDFPVNHIVVAFNHEVDASLINYTTLVVDRVGNAASPDMTGETADPVHLPAFATLADGNANVVVITPVAPLLPGTYRVTVRGTGGGALADLDARALGSDYSFTFTVDVTP